MTNPVFDDNERERWLADPQVGADPRFKAVLRIDPMLRDWPTAAQKLTRVGLRARATRSTPRRSKRRGGSCATGSTGRRRSISRSACRRSSAIPATGDDAVARAGQTMLEKVVLPVCAERGLPVRDDDRLARCGVNPAPARRRRHGRAGRRRSRSSNLCREFPQQQVLRARCSPARTSTSCASPRGSSAT